MKEQRNYPEELNEMKTSNLSDTKLKVMIIRILNIMTKYIETIKKYQSEIECNIRNN